MFLSNKTGKIKAAMPNKQLLSSKTIIFGQNNSHSINSIVELKIDGH